MGAAVLSSGPCPDRREGIRAFGGDQETVRWISPRGTPQVMDDFNLWVLGSRWATSRRSGSRLIAGSVTDALASTKFVAQNKADMGYPSPGALTASIDSGMGVNSIWDVISGQVFNFGLPARQQDHVAEAAER